ncbi:hypothetical protein JTE90_025198 [Oedothorax gibbosus]|uniref:Uncharacterized protein n=1 Tax=Oedothorax gibbosus TaxID=931172 RepID=A0AAV6UR24_9ARAC|nr:hypothetical protein JTE90_025198 [Oedothorax gibbosus]
MLRNIYPTTTHFPTFQINPISPLQIPSKTSIPEASEGLLITYPNPGILPGSIVGHNTRAAHPHTTAANNCSDEG